MKRSILTAAVAAAMIWTAGPAVLNAQATSAAAKASSDVPRTPDGHPDLSGVWWLGADVGGKPLPGTPGVTAGGRGRGGPAPETFTSLYQPWAKEKAKTLSDKDDPALGCRSTAFGTLNVSLFDVGAVAQIVQTPKFVIMLRETYNGFQIVPFDGRPHREDMPPSNRGDAIGRWDGDTFVVDRNNFNDSTWMGAEGRVSFHSNALHIVERYTRLDAKRLQVEATVEDPKVLTKAWVVPKQTLYLAPFDQILELDCFGAESEAVMDAAAKTKK